MNLRALVMATSLALSACAAHSQPTTTPAATARTAPAALDASGHVRATTRFASAPVGGRGGAYVLQLEPDGTAMYTLLDANVAGTYVVDGTTITFTPATGTPSVFHADAGWSALQEQGMKRA